MVTTTIKTGSPLSLDVAVPDREKAHTRPEPSGSPSASGDSHRLVERMRPSTTLAYCGVGRRGSGWLFLPDSVRHAGEPAVSTGTGDLTNEAFIAALGERLATLDHVVSTTSARARGRLAHLDRDAMRRSFDTKVIRPLMLGQAPGPSHKQRRLVCHFVRRRRGHDCRPRYGPGHHQRCRRHLRPLPGRRNWHRSGSTLSSRTSSRRTLEMTSESRARRAASPSSAPVAQPSGSAPSTTSHETSCCPDRQLPQRPGAAHPWRRAADLT
jgi:hypothetical protein